MAIAIYWRDCCAGSDQHTAAVQVVTHQTGASLVGSIVLQQSVPGVTKVQGFSCAHWYKYMRAVTTGGGKKSGNCCCCSRRYEHRCPCEARTARAVLEICWRDSSCGTRTPARYEVLHTTSRVRIRYSYSLVVMQYSFRYEV